MSFDILIQGCIFYISPPPQTCGGDKYYPWWKKYYFHYEILITLIFLPFFLSILVMENKNIIITSLKLS